MLKADKTKAFLAERKRRRVASLAGPDASDSDKAALLVAAMQPHQRALYESTARHDAVLAPRQTGKSWGVLLLTFASCLFRRDSEWVIIGPTLKSLKRIYIPVFRVLNRKFELGIVFNKTDLTFHFTNGSVIHFIGADKEGEVDKVRGGAFDGIVVDESQFFPIADFDYMLEDVLEAAILARKGRLVIIGTPGSVLQGEFYLATSTPPELRPVPNDDGEGFNPGPPANYPHGEPEGDALWCKHCWSPMANQANPGIWAGALALKAKKGWHDTHPKWMREYLGKWVATNDILVYRYNPHYNSYDGTLPDLPQGYTWRKVLGVDLGSTDGTAMVVWAFSPGSPNLYEVYSHKEVKTDLQAINVSFIARWRNRLAELHGPFDYEVCDPGGLADIVLETLSDDHGVWLEKAEVRQKEDHIELVNDDFDSRRVFLVRGSLLEHEMSTNRWLKDRRTNTIPPQGRRKEDPNTPNDVADAGLYAFRACSHRRYTTKKEDTRSLLQRMRDEEKAAILALVKSRQRVDEDPCLNLN